MEFGAETEAVHDISAARVAPRTDTRSAFLWHQLRQMRVEADDIPLDLERLSPLNGHDGSEHADVELVGQKLLLDYLRAEIRLVGAKEQLW